MENNFKNGTQGKNCCAITNNSLPALKNYTDLPTLTISGKIRVIATMFLFLTSCILNVSFLIKVYRWEKKNKSSRMKVLLKHLMLANLLETVIVMPLDGVWNITVQWYAGEFLCKVLNFLKLFSMYAPAFMVVVISLDRCLAITRPFSVKNNNKFGKYNIHLAWTISLILAGPQIFVFGVIDERYRADSDSMEIFFQCVTHKSFTEWWQQTFYNLFTFGCIFVTPLLIMLVCNFKIIFTMTQVLRQDPSKMDLKRSKNNIPQARLKTLKMTIAFATSFIICWAPYYVLGIWYWFEPEILRWVSDPVYHFFCLFGLLNPCFDPLIYGYFSL
ncbi:gonadotropin-releasing hormone receptor-like [Latimeria chalumnae]|uniref:Gonadotropin-releasing hormone receptor n=1 Tax=Latimeria chalumnae TaxID=7897 RepID=H2ZYH6_LATCH|nr:gonadotropin-releasing hormone receptor-like [Latimeria chalumnae]AGJ70272.1 type I gonadotropin-releasing hormone receptor [Latimeria chalumnae]|eukprot:NP_001273664.1 gonadotropin-releasing hormone receptor-like [Latimeria chalumnae]